jgi:hypothetical protein
MEHVVEHPETFFSFFVPIRFDAESNRNNNNNNNNKTLTPFFGQTDS